MNDNGSKSGGSNEESTDRLKDEVLLEYQFRCHLKKFVVRHLAVLTAKVGHFVSVDSGSIAPKRFNCY